MVNWHAQNARNGPDVNKGCLDRNIIQTAIWKKHEKDIKILVENRPKIRDRYSDDKNERDYINKQNICA